MRLLSPHPPCAPAVPQAVRTGVCLLPTWPRRSHARPQYSLLYGTAVASPSSLGSVHVCAHVFASSRRCCCLRCVQFMPCFLLCPACATPVCTLLVLGMYLSCVTPCAPAVPRAIRTGVCTVCAFPTWPWRSHACPNFSLLYGTAVASPSFLMSTFLPTCLPLLGGAVACVVCSSHAMLSVVPCLCHPCLRSPCLLYVVSLAAPPSPRT